MWLAEVNSNYSELAKFQKIQNFWNLKNFQKIFSLLNIFICENVLTGPCDE